MLTHTLLVAHIVVLGYWLGAELVINATYRYVCFRDAMPFPERVSLMDRIRCMDQHVRYALVLQAGLGTALAMLLGYLPGGETGAITAGIVAAVWLAYVEFVHQQRNAPAYPRLALVDRGSRYVLMATLVLLAVTALAGRFALQPWLAWKLLCFAGVMGCGVGIRLQGLKMAAYWADIAENGSIPEREALVRRTCIRATTILAALWIFIALIATLSVFKPGG